jgi:signal transduction histidine kinase
MAAGGKAGSLEAVAAKAAGSSFFFLFTRAYWAGVGRRLRWVTHPITVFVTLQIVWIAITLIWVIWFVGQKAEMAELAQKFGSRAFDSSTALVILIVGCVLLGMLLVGTISLFIFGQRQTYLASQQRTFVSSVTHELKSPLASLQLGFETMNRHKLDPDTAARVSGMIMADIERLKRLVDQILVAGRLDRGAFMFSDQNERCNIQALVAQIVDKLSYLAADLQTRLAVDLPEELTMKVASQTLDLVLSNLLENAIKYSPSGSPITLTARDTGDKVLFSIADRGHGLDKKDLRRIFKIFYRSEGATRKAIPGTGLGLYIVRSVIKVLGGRVWAASDGLGYGATFFVELPRGYFTTDPRAPDDGDM